MGDKRLTLNGGRGSLPGPVHQYKSYIHLCNCVGNGRMTGYEKHTLVEPSWILSSGIVN